MKTRNHIYDSYGLLSTDFNLAQFEIEWGKKLKSNQFRNIAISIIEEGAARRFLAHKLSSDSLAKINAKETMRSAKNAEYFRQKVASVQINECREPLVDLRELPEATTGIWTFTNQGYHEACGEWAGKKKLFLVRGSVAEKLTELAHNLLAFNIKLHFQDGFRPTGVQEGLFLRRIDMARQSHPEWIDQEILLEAKSKTAFTPRFAAHKAGAAVDVSMYDDTSREFLDIGQGYPGGGEIVRLNTEFVTQHQWQNRKVLEYLARKSGLSMYPYENWHLCYGDTTAAVVNSKKPPYTAKYGPIKECDLKSGKIIAGYSSQELDTVFSAAESGHVRQSA